jgi:hypothetical protein
MQLSTNNQELILACHITGIYDVNRSNTLQNDDYLLIKEWAESIVALRLKGIVFHNNFSKETISKFQNEHIQFIKIEYDSRFNPNVFRYIVYEDFLKKNADFIKSVFLTDVSDVVVITNPFTSPFFIENPELLFCGDEPKPLENDWMLAHSAHLRSKIANYVDFEKQFKTATLLNCGIIGGNINVMSEFVEKLSQLHQLHNFDNQTAYTGDMGAFNYLARTQFNERLAHGMPCNTVFKEYQNDRKDCWFRHK